MTPKIILLLVGCFAFFTGRCQNFTNDAGTREKHFVYEVKQIDEFIERFNDVRSSFLRDAYRAYNVKFRLTRKDLVRSLFNYETNTWTAAAIDSFVLEITDPSRQQKLNFYGDNWFAEAVCRFSYNNSIIQVPLIMRVATDGRLRSKWMIAAAGQNDFSAVAGALPPGHGQEGNKFINPASHGNNFIELKKALNDKENLSEYFDDAFFTRRNGQALFSALQEGSLKFISVKAVHYHFLQAGNWIFTVEYFRRPSLNSGWLINHLQQAPASAKQQYLEKLMGVAQ